MVEDPLAGLSHFRHGNDTESANESVDPGTEENQIGPSGQDIDEFRLVWEFMSGCELWRGAACGPAGDQNRQARSFGSSSTCHMNTTVQTLTTATIIIEL